MKKPTKKEILRLKVEMLVEVFKALPETHQDAVLGYLGLKRK